MPNAMPDNSGSECGERESGLRESMHLTSLSAEDIRTCDQISSTSELEKNPGSESHDSPSILSSLMNRNEVSSGGSGEEDKAGFLGGPRISNGYGGSIRDYIGFSDGASSSAHGELVDQKKSGDENVIMKKLGPKTKETELRLGLPEDYCLLQKDGGLQALGSGRGSDLRNPEKKTDSSLGPQDFDNGCSALEETKPGDSVLNSERRIVRGYSHSREPIQRWSQQLFSDFPSRDQMGSFVYPKQALNLGGEVIQTRSLMSAEAVHGREYAKNHQGEESPEYPSLKVELHDQERKSHEFYPFEFPNISSLKDLRLPLIPGGVDPRFSPQDIGGDAHKYRQDSLPGPSELIRATAQSHEVSHHAQDYSGRAFVLSPKNMTAGAKRGFSDALGACHGPAEGRMSSVPASNASCGPGVAATEIDSKLSTQLQQQKPVHPPPAFTSPWAAKAQFMPSTWQINWEQQPKGSFGPFPPPVQSRSVVMSTNRITGDTRSNSMGEPAASPSLVELTHDSVSGSRLPPAPAISERKQSPTEDKAAPDGNGAAAEPRAPPVVGWPPIRSFRKNLAVQPKLAPESQLHISGNPSTGNPSTSADPGLKNSNTMFVKVNVDGVAIGRKIDLKAYNSYDKLFAALEDMFRGFIDAQNSVANPSSENNHNQGSLLSGTDYVFVYEDNEGDRMLVGDVPWEMFVSTVKRLRVMKGSEAGGLANRQPLKLTQ